VIVVLSPVPRPLTAATRRCRSRRRNSADERNNLLSIASFICTEDHCLRRRDAAAAGKEDSADQQKNRERGYVPSNIWCLHPLAPSFSFPSFNFLDLEDNQ
jgi:hypothetical protein